MKRALLATVVLAAVLSACAARPQYGIVKAGDLPIVTPTPSPTPELIKAVFSPSFVEKAQGGSQAVSFDSNLPEKTLINLSFDSNGATSTGTSLVASAQVAFQAPIPKEGAGYVEVTMSYDPGAQDDPDERFSQPAEHTAYLPYPDANTAMADAIGKVDLANGEPIVAYLPISVDPAAWQFVINPDECKEPQALAQELASALEKTDFAPPVNGDRAGVVLKDGEENVIFSSYSGFIPTIEQSKKWVLVDTETGYIHNTRSCDRLYFDSKVKQMLEIVARMANYSNCRSCIEK